jgi:type III secretion protein J
MCMAILLAGCSRSEVYTDLNEREANEMIAVLSNSGIAAAKVSQDGKSWSLSTGASDFAQAVRILKARGFPKQRFESLGDVFKKQGLVSTPLEEHARLVYGLSQELSNTISGMDGVISARVLISIPESDGLSEIRPPSSASAFIKYDPEVDLSSQVPSIKSLVSNSVVGVPYDHVTVVLSPARDMSSAPNETHGAPPPGMWAALGGLALAGGVFIVWLLGRRRLAPRELG